MTQSDTSIVLLVEDDAALGRGLHDALRSEGLEVVLAADGHAGMKAITDCRFDLVLLDLMLPGPSGLEILRRLRETDTVTPVLILTARGDEDDRVLGLELGADDYVTKPFSLRELLARVRAMLRRAGRGPKKSSPVFRLGDLTVDLGTHGLRRGESTETLSPKEAAMLRLLYGALGDVVSRSTFLEEVWGQEQFVGNRTIDTHMLNLRQKVEVDASRPEFLLTVHGVGYRLVVDGNGPGA